MENSAAINWVGPMVLKYDVHGPYGKVVIPAGTKACIAFRAASWLYTNKDGVSTHGNLYKVAEDKIEEGF
jgi:hypothetical protein